MTESQGRSKDVSTVEDVKHPCSSSYSDLLQQAVKVLAPLGYSEQIRMAVESLVMPTHDRMRQIVEAATFNYSDEMRKAYEAMVMPGHERMRQIVEAATFNYSDQVRKAIETLAAPSNHERIRQILEAVTPSYSDQIQHPAAITRSEKFLAEIASNLSLLNKPTLKRLLMATESGPNFTPQMIGAAGFDSLSIGDVWNVEILENVDQEIANAISEGSIDALPSAAKQKLMTALFIIYFLLEAFIVVPDTITAYTFYTELLQNASVPSDITTSANLLSAEQRELLSDYRVVNRQGARLRPQPTTESKPITTLNFADVVEVLEYNDKGWYRVLTETSDGLIEGWVYVTVTTPISKPRK